MQPQDHSACLGMPSVLAHPLQNSEGQPDGRKVGRRKNMDGEDYFTATTAAPSDEERNPTRRAAVAAVLRLGSRRFGGVHTRHAVPAKRAAHLPPTEHMASFGEGHRANSMTVEADDLMAETLEMGVRRRGLSSSCISGLLRNLWQGISPLCFPSHSSYVLSV